MIFLQRIRFGVTVKYYFIMYMLYGLLGDSSVHNTNSVNDKHIHIYIKTWNVVEMQAKNKSICFNHLCLDAQIVDTKKTIIADICE